MSLNQRGKQWLCAYDDIQLWEWKFISPLKQLGNTNQSGKILLQSMLDIIKAHGLHLISW